MTKRRPWTVRGEYERDPRGYIERRSMPEPLSGCWLWLKSLSAAGYGNMGVSGIDLHLAHRASYLAFKGPIPDGLVVRHRCDNPPCVNPDHLDLGTHKDNSDDKFRRGRAGYEKLRGKPQPKLRKLTPEQAIEIARSDERQDVLALRYGVSLGTIRNVRHGLFYGEIVGTGGFADRRFVANRNAPMVRPRSPFARRKLIESLLKRSA